MGMAFLSSPFESGCEWGGLKVCGEILACALLSLQNVFFGLRLVLFTDSYFVLVQYLCCMPHQYGYLPVLARYCLSTVVNIP